MCFESRKILLTWFAISLIALAAATSLTRLGDLLDFGQVFKAYGNN